MVMNPMVESLKKNTNYINKSKIVTMYHISVANEGLLGCPTKNIHNKSGGDCYWAKGQPIILIFHGFINHIWFILGVNLRRVIWLAIKS